MKRAKSLKSISLEDLKVESFVTGVKDNHIQGGATITCRCTLKLCH